MWTADITFAVFFIDVLYVGVGSGKSFFEKIKPINIQGEMIILWMGLEFS